MNLSTEPERGSASFPIRLKRAKRSGSDGQQIGKRSIFKNPEWSKRFVRQGSQTKEALRFNWVASSKRFAGNKSAGFRSFSRSASEALRWKGSSGREALRRRRRAVFIPTEQDKTRATLPQLKARPLVRSASVSATNEWGSAFYLKSSVARLPPPRLKPKRFAGKGRLGMKRFVLSGHQSEALTHLKARLSGRSASLLAACFDSAGRSQGEVLRF